MIQSGRHLFVSWSNVYCSIDRAATLQHSDSLPYAQIDSDPGMFYAMITEKHFYEYLILKFNYYKIGPLAPSCSP